MGNDKKATTSEGIVAQIENRPIYPNLTESSLKKAIDHVFNSRSNKAKEFQITEWTSLENIRLMRTGQDSFSMALAKYSVIDTLKWKVKEFSKRNKLSIMESQEYQKCIKGTDEMTGEEYFYYNYFRIKVNGKLVSPSPGSYTPEVFNQKKRNLELKHKILSKRNSLREVRTLSFMKEFPYTPEEAFVKI